MALSSATLAACATASPTPIDPGPAPNPVVTTVVETRLICPAELDQAVGDPPVPAEGTVIRHNDAGGEWLEAYAAWGLRAAGLFNDARAECPPEANPAESARGPA